MQEFGNAIRTARHETTTYTPSYLFYGRETAVPNPYTFDFGNESDAENMLPHSDVTNYINELEHRRKVFFEVRERLKKAHESSKGYYNKTRRQSEFQVGNVVLRRTKFLSSAQKKFKAKLAPKFEKAVITAKLSENVYRLNNAYGKDIGVWHAKDLKR